MLTLRSFLLLLFLFPLLLQAGAAEWKTNYEEALKESDRSGKPVLAEFTGSDWCYYCKRLRLEVLESPDFAAWAAKNFILLEIDQPQHKQIDTALLAQNQMLSTKYQVDGYPTLLVLDSQGRPLGGLFGYMGDPKAVQKELTPGLKAARLLRKAASLPEEQKQAPLLAAWKLIPQELHELNVPLQQEVSAHDPEDRSGLRAAAAAELALQECKAAEAAAPTDTAALRIVEAALEKATPLNKRQLLELQYRLLIRTAETPADVYAAAEVAYAGIDADLRLSEREKESRKRQLRGVFANPQTTLNRTRMLLRKRPAR